MEGLIIHTLKGVLNDCIKHLKKLYFLFIMKIKNLLILKETILTIYENYNKKKHSATQYPPKQVFFQIIKIYSSKSNKIWKINILSNLIIFHLN